MKTGATLVTIIAAAAFAWLLAGIVLAGREQGLMPGIEWIMSRWWGKATLIDLYIGFVITACWIGFTEPDKRWAVFWIINLFWLGNLVSLTVILIRSLKAHSVKEIFLPAR